MSEGPEAGDRSDTGDSSDAGHVDELEAAIDGYLRYKSTDGSGESGYYVNTAGSVLRRFHEWAVDTGNADLALLGDAATGPAIMRRYAARLSERVGAGEIAASTAHTYWSVVSAFFTDARNDGAIDSNPCLGRRAREKLPSDAADVSQQFWTDEARERLFRHVDDRARAAIDERGHDAGTPVRDRALVYLLAYTGVRGAEVFRTSKDAREGRRGLRWRNVDLDGGKLRVFRKTQRWEWTPLPRQARPAVEQWKRVCDPPTGEWPVFPTAHAPSLYAAARGVVGDAADLSGVDVEALLRRHKVPPPSLTVDAARRRVKDFCEEADVRIDGESLTLHGARRGIGHKLFEVDRGEAQDLLGHQNPETTKRAYSDRVAEERSERVSDLLDDAEE